MAEQQSAHRIELESKVIDSDIANSKRGLNYGFILGLIVTISGAVLIYSGKTLIGSVMSGGTIVSLTGTFVLGSQQRRKERMKNQEILQK